MRHGLQNPPQKHVRGARLRVTPFAQYRCDSRICYFADKAAKGCIFSAPRTFGQCTTPSRCRLLFSQESPVSPTPRPQSPSSFLIAAALAAALLTPTARAADPWSFGIMADTQWTGKTDDGKNPNSVAVDSIQQLNQQFINAKVKLVIALGDMTDSGSTAALDTRAAFAQPLYNAGIAFYPVRGNHESSRAAAVEFQRIFPQTQNGRNNATPADVFAVTNKDAATQPTPKPAGTPFTVGTAFSSPSANLAGLSYSFTFNNATFLLLDQFTPADGKASDGTAYNTSNNAIASQQPWITKTLAFRPANTQAFVFSHKGLITQFHRDTLLAANPNSNAASYNTFMGALQSDGVKYYFGGHDHLHNRALVTSPNGDYTLEDITCASGSSKFYAPPAKPNDTLNREKLISQELGTDAYYIVTVDGPRITVDYFATDPLAPLPPKGGESDANHLSDLRFSKHETFGYDGAGGREFQIAQGAPYTAVDGAVKAGTSTYGETFNGTTAKILSGANGNTAKAVNDDRPFIKTIDTGWAPPASAKHKSDVLFLWGMSNVSDNATDTFALSLTFDPTAAAGLDLATGALRLQTKDAGGSWIDAVDANTGGRSAKRFVLGAWNSTYGLGTFGVDPTIHTAWAVVNHAGSFVVAAP